MWRGFKRLDKILYELLSVTCEGAEIKIRFVRKGEEKFCTA